MNLITFAEKRIFPDVLIRFGIRNLLRKRLKDEHFNNPKESKERFFTLLDQLKNSHIALETEAANEQHYEVPAEFYTYALGKHLKYSACLWDEGVESLDVAEQAMLKLYCERAGIVDGQQVLELGCGWGSLTLWIAEHYPNSHITGVSNSHGQRRHIEAQAEQRGLKNISIITADVNQFDIEKKFDRVVSIEMFEHMRNYEHLMSNIAGWLKADGQLFIHIFCHNKLMYPFETEGDDNWMGKYFFTGGLMPAVSTLSHFQNHLSLKQQWDVSGVQYQKTSEAWLQNMDANKGNILKVFNECYGADSLIWFQRWRMFFMACAELFGYKQGKEWHVAHYLFEKGKTD